ncbi:MAG: response regulator transcription factor [Planctomycetales bacterium]|nr:response regulator transcription factor [Planctomycetales bacterium]
MGSEVAKNRFDSPSPPPPSKNVFIVDDDTRICRFLEEFLGSRGYDVATYCTGEAFLQDVTPHSRGCLVLDILLSGISGLELQERMNRLGIHIPVIILSARGSVSTTVRAMKNGAVACLEKPANLTEILTSVQEALLVEKERRYETTLRESIMQTYRQLSHREKEVCDLLVKGLNNREIAAQLNMGLRTIERDKQMVFRKTNVASVAELVKFYVKLDRKS